jgi:hypothetical protein
MNAYVFSSLFTIHFLRKGASSSENNILVRTVSLKQRAFAKGVVKLWNQRFIVRIDVCGLFTS